ncbi:thioredoxin family protein [Chitinophaga lutea]|nr:thioredoxin family protein [Chitinophaga lutea]
MKKLLLLFMTILPAIVFAQEKGIRFEHGLTWEQIKAKAKQENKYIFLDCFTTWCGPCKFMSSSIFPLEEVGEYYNSRFLSVKLQLDTTKQDSEEVKSWYATGQALAREYKVTGYPTFLFLDPDGQPVHRIVGSSPDGATWLKRTAKVFEPGQQYYALMKKYESGDRDPATLRAVAAAAMDAFDQKTADAASKAYITTVKDWSAKENIEFAAKFTRSSKDPGFKIMLQEPEKVNAVLGEGKAQQAVKQIVLREEVYRHFWIKGKSNPDVNWKAITDSLKKKYPAYADEAVAMGKVTYYQSQKDWDKFAPAVVSYMKKYGATTSAFDLNEFAWTVFEHCKDMTCVTEALEWSRRSFKDRENPNHIDTYANILYKMGKKDEAISWQEKAVAYSTSPQEKKAFQATLDKMKKGEKTWKHD